MGWASILMLAVSAAEFYQQGVSAFRRGAADDALKPLSQAVELEPENAVYRKALGVAFAAQELYLQAEEQFGAACRLDPKLADVCYYHARALYALNRSAPALTVLEDLETKGAREYAALAQAEDALGRVQDAERDYRKACRQETRRASSMEPPCLLYGVFLFKQGRLEEAVDRLEQVGRRHPKHPRAQFELGRALYQQGRLQPAIDHLQAAASLGHGPAADLLLDKARRRLKATAAPAR